MLVISGTVANILPFSKKDSSTKYVNKEIEIDTDNVNIDRLFNNVKVTSKNLFNDSNYSNKEKIIVKDLNTISKYRIASNIYLKELKFKNGLYYVDEKFVKDAYELLFGDGTYFREDQIPYYNNINLVFDGESYSSQEKVVIKIIAKLNF